MGGLLDGIAKERSSYTITLSNWVDAIGETVLPEEISWTLTDLDGNIINGRDEVALTPDDTVVILLDSDDLVVTTAEQYKDTVIRIISVAATYTSSLGNDLWTREEYRLRIAPLRNVV
jgi:hypothetical protein